MFRPPIKSSASNGASNIGGKQSNNDNSPTTIREIRSRTIGSTSNSNAKNLLANRRQAMSMERLNSATTVIPTVQSSNDKEKSSASSGSSNSINGSISSPIRGAGAGLNRTASRVSRFRSAKAVFERLSSNNNNSIRLDKPVTPEKPRGTAASRYATAATARATTLPNSSNVTTCPRSRLPTGSLSRCQDSGKSASNTEIHKSTNNTNSPKFEATQPRPQPRVITNRTTAIASVASSSTENNGVKNRLSTNNSTATKSFAQAKPPSKDLIDKIVLEIALDAGKQDPDANCTIQDLSNCDISGIPETLDFDRCFQDVEMMTEEEARKLLSRKPNIQTSSLNASSSSVENTSDENKMKAIEIKDNISETKLDNIENEPTYAQANIPAINQSNPIEIPNTTVSSANKCKVRFSDEPVKIFNTHAVEDYDRRNDDIDPVAASAEYEIEKSKEREDMHDSDDENPNEFRANDFIENQKIRDSSILGNLPGTLHNLHNASQNDFRDSSGPTTRPVDQIDEDEEERTNKKVYIESLEREVNLKRILEQNLRDLQSQYYEAVKELDEYKGSTESKLLEHEQNIADLNGKLEFSQNELTDARGQSDQFEKQLNNINESSQILEKKYHRAKRIIKDMQSREQSFSRREQLYQQKLDEIEYELGVLIDSIDKTIYDDGLKFYTITDDTSCQRQHQTRFDVFGLIRQMLNNFNVNQSTQNPQIKQRIVSILEQQLANLMVLTNGNTSVAGIVAVVSFTPSAKSLSNDSSQNLQVESNKHSQNPSYQLASHRLSQPNLPHPIGVSGQPTKLFHGLNPTIASINEPSPPQSVNSYPSTNSLNSLNNNNHSANNNNIIMATKFREQPSISDLQLNTPPIVTSTTNSTNDDKFQPAPDIQVPYQTNEWHDKPVSEWTTTQVSTWLLALGLDQYISKFEDRNVNGQSLINLDSTVLKGLGVLNSNDRNLLKKKIRELRVEMEKERKQIEKKMKENLKDKSKNKFNGSNKTDNKADSQQSKPLWKKSLLS